jgi:hypothetical protein
VTKTGSPSSIAFFFGGGTDFHPSLSSSRLSLTSMKITITNTQIYHVRDIKKYKRSKKQI